MNTLDYAMHDDYLTLKEDIYRKLKSAMRSHPVVKEYVRVNDNLDAKLNKFKEIKELK